MAIVRAVPRGWGFLAVAGLAIVLTACSTQLNTKSAPATATPSDQRACMDWHDVKSSLEGFSDFVQNVFLIAHFISWRIFSLHNNTNKTS